MCSQNFDLVGKGKISIRKLFFTGFDMNVITNNININVKICPKMIDSMIDLLGNEVLFY